MAARKLFKFENGEVLRDKVSGFQGVCTGRFDYLNGCKRYTILAKVVKEGDSLNEYTFDEQQLEKVKQAKAEVKAGNTGGPRSTPARSGI